MTEGRRVLGRLGLGLVLELGLGLGSVPGSVLGGSARAEAPREPAPMTADDAVRLGDSAFEQGDMARADALYAKALATDPKGRLAAYATYKRGWVAVNTQAPDRALAAFRAARDLAARDPKAASLVREADRDRARTWASFPARWEAALADLRATPGLDAATSDDLAVRLAEALADGAHEPEARLLVARLGREVKDPRARDRLDLLTARLGPAPH